MLDVIQHKTGYCNRFKDSFAACGSQMLHAWSSGMPMVQGNKSTKTAGFILESRIFDEVKDPFFHGFDMPGSPSSPG